MKKTFNFAEKLEESMLLTVIIPVYNTELTLKRCIESVLSQQVQGGMEVILVDDGSPDNCPALCDTWAERDNRVRVIHQQNKGLGAARNAGLDIATGEYVTFVDSDDYLAANTYPHLLKRMEEQPDIDILEYGIEMSQPQQAGCKWADDKWLDARQYWLQTRAWWHSYAWNKLYKRRLFDEVRYADNVFCEDLLILVQLLERKPVVATAKLGTYIYVWNKNGLTANATAKKVRQLLETMIYAKKVMRMSLFTRGGIDFLRAMLYRQIDLYRLSGEVILPWPFVRPLCWLHKRLKG